jgi:hypothetical protein
MSSKVWVLEVALERLQVLLIYVDSMMIGSTQKQTPNRKSDRHNKSSAVFRASAKPPMLSLVA